MAKKTIRVSGLVRSGAIPAGQGPSAALPVFEKRGLPPGGRPLAIPVADIAPNPYQPRTQFLEEELAALAASIQEIGLVQPVAVRRAGEGFQLIAGERRWRAVKLLGRDTIDAFVHELEDADMAVMAVAENVDRADLSDYEIGKAVRRIESLFPSKARLAEALGMAREDLYRYLAFEALPAGALGRLEANPRLLSRAAACELRRVLGGAADAALAEAALAEALDLLEAGALEQGRLAAHLAARLKGGPAPAPRQHHPLHLGEAPVGSLQVGPGGVTVKIKPGVLCHARAADLHRLIAEFLAAGPSGA